MTDRLTITPLDGLGIASVMARKGIDREAIGAAMGMDLPRGPGATFAGPRTAVGTGPGTWLLFTDNAAPDFAEMLGGTLAGLASVSDQSSVHVVRRLSGPHARTLLQRGIAIDLHPDVFRTGTAAATVIAHIGVILWQVDDLPSYDAATLRSYDRSFEHWLEQAVAALCNDC